MNKLVAIGMASLAVVGVVGMTAMSVSAVENENGNVQNGMQKRDGNSRGDGKGQGRQSSLEARAAVVGMTVSELEMALKTKTFSEIAKEKGMTETDFHAKMAEAAKTRWEARGLSDDEIAKRVADREARHAANAVDHEWGSGEGDRQGGYRRNR